MVQTYQSPVRVYKYPFEIVMAAYEKRFPTCKMIPVFLGSDILSEYKSEDGATHTVERKCRVAIDAPYILKKIAGVEHVNFLQKNTLDRRSRTLNIEARNDSFSSRIIINEHCCYSVHAENPAWTSFEQDASLDIKSFFGFESTVEKIAMKQYTLNIQKGKEVIEYYIGELLSEGITCIPPWKAPQEIEKRGSISHPSEEAYREKPGTSKEQDAVLPDTHFIKKTPDTDDVLVEETAAEVTHSPSHARSSSTSSHSSLMLGASAANISLEPLDMCKKLEADYIQRFLGQLTLYQESKFVQLRKWLQATHKGKLPKPSVILRFLKARDFNVEKGREMLCHSMAWRKLHGIDRLLQTYEPPPVINKYYAGGWHYHDKDGRPLYILRLGQMDVKGLIKSVGEDGLLRHVLSVNEEGVRRCEEATKLSGRPITNCTCIVDLEGLSMRHVWRPGISALLRIIETVEANYPETMGFLLIVRAPRVFPVLWTLVNPFIDENTRRKFLIYGGKDYQGAGGLVDYIDKHYIPDFLGGHAYCDVPEGGHVPKSLYTCDDEAHDECLPFGPDNLYQTAYVMKEYAHEVLVQVPMRGSVITWDFDILKGDVTFIVLRCRKTLTSSPHEHHVSGATGGVGSTQYIDKHFTVGVDVSIVEPPLVCRDGDSIQGSHVTSQGGSYILQWKYFDSAKGSFDILSTHKSKVMYYTEMLKSEHFKGSMSSLQSCQSSFSHLSIANSTSGHSSMTHSSCPSR